jgi:hypothetical protein
LEYRYLKDALIPAERKRLTTAISAERRLTGRTDTRSRHMIANKLVDATRGETRATGLDPELVDWLLSYGRPNLIQAFLNQCPFDPRDHFSLGVLQAAEPTMLLPRDYIAPHFQSWQKRPQARHALIAFAGNAQRLNMPVQLFHSLFYRSFDLIFYLRDPSRQRFSQGLPGLGTTFDELCRFLRRRIPEDCAISVLGTSAGGYAAAALANRMEVARVALFSPPAVFEPGPAVGRHPTTPAGHAAVFFATRNATDHELAKGWTGNPYAQSIRWVDTTSHGTLAVLVSSGATERLIAWLRTEAPARELLGERRGIRPIAEKIRTLFARAMR